jgi:hypothetical protein
MDDFRAKKASEILSRFFDDTTLQRAPQFDIYLFDLEAELATLAIIKRRAIAPYSSSSAGPTRLDPASALRPGEDSSAHREALTRT